MEELFCIGCGAQIQTTAKEQAGYTPKSALEKGLKAGKYTANAVLDCVIITKSQMCIFQMMIF